MSKSVMREIYVRGFFAATNHTRIHYKLYTIKEEKWCVFSQKAPIHLTTSSVNLADRIILSICTLETIDFKRYRFFDFMTYEGYGGTNIPIHRGTYEFHEITGYPKNLHWDETRCPENIVRDFMSERVPTTLIAE